MTLHNRLSLCAVAVLILAAADESGTQVIVDTSTVNFQVGQFTKEKQKLPAGPVQRVDGKFAKAVQFNFVDGAAGGFMTAALHPSDQWNKSDGFSFWVKGDGSNNWGGIELIDHDNFSLRYGYCFPIDSTDWRKITVRWRDVIPELAGPLVAANGGYAPAGFGNFWFGKWFYWRDYPAESFAIERVALEPTIAPLQPVQVPPGISRVHAKLKEHKPLTIVTMGDSLTDRHHWSNLEIHWTELLAKEITSKYGSEVRIVNPAIGGTTLSQNMILMPRWSARVSSPDLVTVWFGGNDWEAGVRGPRFAQYLHLCVQRIREQTRGSADILLLTTDPTYANWQTYKELEQAVRDVASQEHAGLVDIAQIVRKDSSADQRLKEEYWAWDKVHLGRHGHEMVKDAVMAVLAPK